MNLQNSGRKENHLQKDYDEEYRGNAGTGEPKEIQHQMELIGDHKMTIKQLLHQTLWKKEDKEEKTRETVDTKSGRRGLGTMGGKGRKLAHMKEEIWEVLKTITHSIRIKKEGGAGVNDDRGGFHKKGGTA